MYPPLCLLLVAGVGVADTLGFLGVMSAGSLSIFLLLVVEKGKSKFDVLPDGWVTLCHDSGLQVYLHRQSRVVSMSRPFFVGNGNARVSISKI